MSSEHHDFTSVPAGTYLVEVRDVRVGESLLGQVRWSLALEVVAGEFEGRHAAWDAIVFSPRGMARTRRVLDALGIRDHDGAKPADLEGRAALVTVRPAEYLSATGGRVTVTARNEVPYEGWEAAS